MTCQAKSMRCQRPGNVPRARPAPCSGMRPLARHLLAPWPAAARSRSECYSQPQGRSTGPINPEFELPPDCYPLGFQPGPALLSPQEEVTLTVDGGKEVVAKKALLAVVSSKLGDMLRSDRSRKVLEVQGSAAAWQFIVDFPRLHTSARLAVFKANDPKAAQLAAEVLPVAIKYNMPEVHQECVDFAFRWTGFSPSDVSSVEIHNPNNTIWWFKLAADHGCPVLAAPALTAMVEISSNKPPSWSSARQTVVDYAKQQQGQLWLLVRSVLEGCNRKVS